MDWLIEKIWGKSPELITCVRVINAIENNDDIELGKIILALEKQELYPEEIEGEESGHSVAFFVALLDCISQGLEKSDESMIPDDTRIGELIETISTKYENYLNLQKKDRSLTVRERNNYCKFLNKIIDTLWNRYDTDNFSNIQELIIQIDKRIKICGIERRIKDFVREHRRPLRQNKGW